MNYLLAALIIIVAYLIGSVNFAVIFSRYFKKVDVRDYGSGNAGTTNVMRVAGPKAGALTFIFDALKGAIACTMGYFAFKLAVVPLSDAAPILNQIHGAFFCGLSCVIGHCWPIFFDFRGGKAAATCVGIFFVCCYPAGIVAAAVFAIMFIATRIVSVSTLVTAVGVVIATVACAFLGFFGEVANPYIISVIAVIMGIIIFVRHKANIERLAHGEEKVLTVAHDEEK